jgi:hypothetical protein
MAEWKKVIVSGSQAELAAVSASIGLLVGTNQQITTDQSTTFLTGSFTGSFKGIADLPDLTHGEGISPFTYDGSTTATISVSGAADLSNNTIIKWDDNDGKFQNTNITDNGTLVTVSVDAQFDESVTITGDLTVSGTASFQNTENLLVADRFALFASGSTTTGDGGIIIQQGTQNIGELFGYDSATTRWGFTSSFNAASSTFTPSVYAGAVQVGTGQTAGSTAPIYGGASNGYGTIHIDTDDSEIWIYA